ncbi:MAG: S8 family peptidase [Bdellovibrionales bacterium]
MLSRKPLIIFSLLFCLLLVSCSQQETEQESFVQPTAHCASQAVSGQFIVQWTDGRVSVEHASSQEDFLENVLKKNQNQIVLAEHDYQIRLQDFLVSDVAPMTGRDPTDWGQTSSQVQTLWNELVYGQNVLVAVIDTGSDITHPQLAPQVYVNKNEIPGNGIDDDNNGYVDDISGWNYVTGTPNMEGELTHGTHVAGITVAKHGAGEVKGLAPSAKLIPLKFIDGDGGYLGHAVEAIQYAAKIAEKANQPLVINASWGGSDCSAVLKRQMVALEGKRILFSVAAGNERRNLDISPVFPAAFNLANQITVSAYSARNVMADFSNYGLLAHVVAPGVDIFSTVPGGYLYYHGTSMAAPFVAGAAALLWSKHPQATTTEIRQALMDSVTSGAYAVKSRGSLNVQHAAQVLAQRLGL